MSQLFWNCSACRTICNELDLPCQALGALVALSLLYKRSARWVVYRSMLQRGPSRTLASNPGPFCHSYYVQIYLLCYCVLPGMFSAFFRLTLMVNADAVEFSHRFMQQRCVLTPLLPRLGQGDWTDRIDNTLQKPRAFN
ncbi:hypothetical protein BDW67DRAFT_76488 [Aspergillus spinulosporus]